jgi:hypothetical protein
MKSFKAEMLTKDLDNKQISIRCNVDYSDQVVLPFDKLIGDVKKQAERYLEMQGFKPFFYTEVDGAYIILTDLSLNKLKE